MARAATPVLYWDVKPSPAIVVLLPVRLVGRSVMYVFYISDLEVVRRKITLCLEQYGPTISWGAPLSSLMAAEATHDAI